MAHGTYEVLDRPVSGSIARPSGTSDDMSEAPDRGILRALCSRNPQVWVSHVTAAQLYGLPLPPRFRAWPLHLSGFGRSHRSPEDPQIRLHRARRAAPSAHHDGVRVAQAPWVFVEMAALLTVEELVVLGDRLVREPHRDAYLNHLNGVRNSAGVRQAGAASPALTRCSGNPTRR